MRRGRGAIPACILLTCAPGAHAEPFPPTIVLNDLDGTDGFIIDGIEEHDELGNRVSAAGDLNGDGVGDVLIGSYECGSEDCAGAVYVLFGAPELGSSGKFDVTTLNGANGFAVVGTHGLDEAAVPGDAHDVNGDGLDDFLVGADGASTNALQKPGAGMTYVLFGSRSVGPPVVEASAVDGSNGFALRGVDDGPIDASSTPRNGGYGDGAGGAVSGIGDFNGDGFADMATTAVEASPDGLQFIGESYVVFGGPSVARRDVLRLGTLDGDRGFFLRTNTANLEQFGLTGAGDVNHDGFADLLIHASAPFDEHVAGVVYVVFGGAAAGRGGVDLSALDGSNGFAIEGTTNDDLGRDAASAGDFNGDGIADVVLTGYAGQTTQAYVIFGSPNIGSGGTLRVEDLDGSNGFRIENSGPAARAFQVATAGDVDGDGIDDVMVELSFSFTGADVIFGGAGVGAGGTFDLASLDGSNGFSLAGVVGALSTAGDVNGDGVADMVIGDASYSRGRLSFVGRAYVVFGHVTTGGEHRSHMGTPARRGR